MTDREIRLELAKVALASGTNIETTKTFYDWVVAAPELEVVDKRTQWDNTSIEELAYKTRIKGTIIQRCRENGISTVGDLIRCGAHKFGTSKNVGKGTIQKIDDALEQYYGISEWYLT